MRAQSLVFVDQASSSAGNFLLVAGAAHAMDLPTFGRFSLGYLAAQFGLELSRALVAEPAQLLEAESGLDTSLKAMLVARHAAAVGLLIGAVLAVVLVGTDLAVVDGLLIAASLPALAWFEGFRHRSLVSYREGRAALASTLWAVLVVGVIAIPPVSDVVLDTPGSAVAGWAACALVASACFIGLDVGHGSASLLELCQRGRRFATETLADRGIIFLGLGLGSWIVGASEFGLVSAGRAVFAATNVAIVALLLLLTTHFIRARASGSVELDFWRESPALRLAVLALPLALFALDQLSGNAIARLFLGDRQPPTIFLAAAAVFFTGVAAAAAPRAWIRASGRDVEAVRLRASNGLAVATAAVVGALTFDGEGLAVGLAVGSILGAGAWHVGATRIPA